MTARAARSALVAVILCATATATSTVFAAAGGGAERTYRGNVRMVSSAAIPGLLPSQQTMALRMTLTRQPKGRIRVVTEGDVPLGVKLKLDAVGSYTSAPAPGGGELLTITFGGEDYRQGVEGSLHDVFRGFPLLRGVKVPITGATGKATLTLNGASATLQSTSEIDRASVGGFRGVAVNRLLPSRITNGFHGELSED